MLAGNTKTISIIIVGVVAVVSLYFFRDKFNFTLDVKLFNSVDLNFLNESNKKNTDPLDIAIFDNPKFKAMKFQENGNDEVIELKLGNKKPFGSKK